MVQISKSVGGILLISCTTIGGGILAIPTHTAQGGFFATILTFSICWFFMSLGALYLLEATLWFKREVNFITLAQETLGKFGAAFVWCVYLLLLLALLCAYLNTSNAWFLKLFESTWQISLPPAVSLLILTISIAAIIFFGTGYTEKINRLLGLTLLFIFLILSYYTLPQVEIYSLHIGNLNAMPTTLPLLLTTFGFAIVVPSLTFYFKQDKNTLFWVVIIGSLVPLILYTIWELIVLGILNIDGPYGLLSLIQHKANGTEVANSLATVLKIDQIKTAAYLFSIFAILTSLLGVSLSLFHFLADGLKLNRTGLHGLLLALITFCPPLCVVLFTPEIGFDRILSFGGLFVALLLGITPSLMVWRGRYYLNHLQDFQVAGGKPLIILTLMFFTMVVGIELFNTFYA